MTYIAYCITVKCRASKFRAFSFKNSFLHVSKCNMAISGKSRSLAFRWLFYFFVSIKNERVIAMYIKINHCDLFIFTPLPRVFMIKNTLGEILWTNIEFVQKIRPSQKKRFFLFSHWHICFSHQSWGPYWYMFFFSSPKTSDLNHMSKYFFYIW